MTERIKCSCAINEAGTEASHYQLDVKNYYGLTWFEALNEVGSTCFELLYSETDQYQLLQKVMHWSC